MESTTTPPASSHPGTLHFIPPNLSAFEPTKPLALSANVNTLIWIGGLFDTYLSVSYPLAIAQSLNPTWSVVMASLDSAGKGWAASSISRDADDMAKIVAYFKNQRPGGKIVIMGHSTGSQDSCTACPPGTMCPGLGTAQPQACSPGTYSVGGASSCTLCESQSCDPTTGLPTTSACGPGTYSNDGHEPCTRVCCITKECSAADVDYVLVPVRVLPASYASIYHICA